MAQSVYSLFLLKASEAWYQLSEEEQAALMAKVDESREKVGGKIVVTCDSSWSSEQWPAFGVEEFPDIEAVQKHAQELNELNWFRYVETMTILGTKWEPS